MHATTANSTKAGPHREARFWNRIAKRYARQPVADEAAYQRKLAVTREYLRPDMEALELGCGTGSTALAHAPYVGQLLATDLSEAMIAIARHKAAEAGVDNLHFQVAAADQVEPDRPLDAVLALSLLHLLDDRDALIARVRGLLKPGGLFITSTACLGDFARWFGPLGAVGHALGLLPRVRIFTRQELEDSLKRAGFAIEHAWQPSARSAVFIVARAGDEVASALGR